MIIPLLSQGVQPLVELIVHRQADLEEEVRSSHAYMEGAKWEVERSKAKKGGGAGL